MFKELWKELPGPVKLAWAVAWGIGMAATVLILWAWALVAVVLWLTG